MKQAESQKITALGVVIFSFIGIIIALLIQAAADLISALLVLKTELPESIIKIGSMIGSSIGLFSATAFLVIFGKIKGIAAAGIVAVSVIMIKIIGNAWMGLGGYISLRGLVGIVFAIVFSLAGAAAGARIKK